MTSQDSIDKAPLIRVDHLTKHFEIRRFLRKKSIVHAVCGASFDLRSGETLGIVGESGCGKTTLLRTILGLYSPTAGQVFVDGQELDYSSRESKLAFWHTIGTVFQDPFSSLDPHMTISDILREPLLVSGDFTNAEARVGAALDQVKLPTTTLRRFPHEFSGGQRQRIAIARALMMRPALIALDEPVSSLDVTVQAEILDLLNQIQQETGAAYILVSHDLAVVSQTCDQVIVMFSGQIVESGETKEIIEHPSHPYTKELLVAVPAPDPKAERTRVVERRLLLQGDKARSWSVPPCPVA